MAFEKEYPDGKKTKYRIRGFLSDIFEREGISGVIAVLIISTACVIATVQVWRGTEISIPKYFSELTTLIVGYYFGSKKSQIRK